MEPCHDPTRQADYLWQCLSLGKRCLGLFLGAGCPQSIRVSDTGADQPLIPDLTGLTEVVCTQMAGDDSCQSAIEGILAHLEAETGSQPNVEDILNHVRSLRAVVGKGDVWGLNGVALDTLDQAICERIVEAMEVPLPHRMTPYHKVAAWLGAADRAFPVEIFTTNYDLLLEQALEESRVPFFDGFVGSRRAFFDPHAIDEDKLPARWARVWKLHGSINWFQDPDGTVYRGASTGEGQRRVIYPSHLKYAQSRRMPYLAMLDRLRNFLRQASAVLVVCGYSFRDDHLNEVILQGLRGNPTAMGFGLLFGELGDHPKAVSLAGDRPNLSLLADDGAVVGTRAGEWLRRGQGEDTPQSPGVEWSPAQEGDGDPVLRARLGLGDFELLGSFVEALVGDGQTVETTANEA